MSTLGVRGKFVVLSCTVAAFGLFTYACSVEDENPPSTRTRGADASPTPTGENPGETPVGAPLCAKYGGYAGVKAIATGITQRVTQDCRISAPLARLSPDDRRHFDECFEIFVGSTFQCPESVYVANQTQDSRGDRCRSMGQAHQGLNLRRADFEAFVSEINAGLEAGGVSLEDRGLLAPSWEGTRTGIVQQNNQSTRNTHCTCAGGTYPPGGGGAPCTVIVDAGQEAGNDAGNDAGAQDASDDG
jgi:hypothetical protein